MAVRSGHGATLIFTTTSTFAPCYTSIGGFSMTRDTLDKSCLATTGQREYLGGDLVSIGESTHSFLLDPVLTDTGEACSLDDLLFVSAGGAANAAETLTLTYVSGSTIAGSALVTGFEIDDITSDQVLTGSITTQWDGVTGPTYTGGV